MIEHPLKNLLLFFALAFAWSWTCWLLAPGFQATSPATVSTLMFLGGFGPGIAALIVVGATGRSAGLRAWLGERLQWRGNRRWMALAFLSPLAVLTLAAAIHVALGGAMPRSPAADHVPMFLANFFLVFLLGGPLGEELGWRGYALPAMQQRLGWRGASVMLGAVWGVWHLPLFFVAGSSQNQGSVPAFFLLIVATSVFYTWLFNRSAGSVVPALLLHTASNWWPALVPVLPTDADQSPYRWLIGLVVTAAFWLLLRRDGARPNDRRAS